MVQFTISQTWALMKTTSLPSRGLVTGNIWLWAAPMLLSRSVKYMNMYVHVYAYRSCNLKCRPLRLCILYMLHVPHTHMLGCSTVVGRNQGTSGASDA